MITPIQLTRPQPPFRILVADDHMMVREGIKMRLSIEDDFEVVGEAANGMDAMACTTALKPDLLLLDLDLPGKNGIDVTLAVKADNETIKVVILTGNLGQHSANAALAAGADGYVTKQDDDVEMLTAIRMVLAGGTYISQKIAAQFSPPSSQINTDASSKALDSLSEREREVLRLVASGMSGPDIADKLGIASSTIRKHRENFMMKLDLHNTAELTAFAIKHGLHQI